MWTRPASGFPAVSLSFQLSLQLSLQLQSLTFHVIAQNCTLVIYRFRSDRRVRPYEWLRVDVMA